MKTTFIISLLLIVPLFAGDITILAPNQQFSSKDSVAIVTLPRLARIDSVVRVYQTRVADYQKDSVACFKGMALSDSLQKKLQLVMQKNALLMTKDSIRVSVDSLLVQKSRIYQGVVEDLQNTVNKNKNSSDGFFNNTFWFFSGTAVGVALTFIASEILHNLH